MAATSVFTCLRGAVSEGRCVRHVGGARSGGAVQPRAICRHARGLLGSGRRSAWLIRRLAKGGYLDEFDDLLAEYEPGPGGHQSPLSEQQHAATTVAWRRQAELGSDHEVPVDRSHLSQNQHWPQSAGFSVARENSAIVPATPVRPDEDFAPIRTDWAAELKKMGGKQMSNSNMFFVSHTNVQDALDSRLRTVQLQYERRLDDMQRSNDDLRKELDAAHARLSYAHAQLTASESDLQDVSDRLEQERRLREQSEAALEELQEEVGTVAPMEMIAQEAAEMARLTAEEEAAKKEALLRQHFARQHELAMAAALSEQERQARSSAGEDVERLEQQLQERGQEVAEAQRMAAEWRDRFNTADGQLKTLIAKIKARRSADRKSVV